MLKRVIPNVTPLTESYPKVLLIYPFPGKNHGTIEFLQPGQTIHIDIVRFFMINKVCKSNNSMLVSKLNEFSKRFIWHFCKNKQPLADIG